MTENKGCSLLITLMLVCNPMVSMSSTKSILNYQYNYNNDNDVYVLNDCHNNKVAMYAKMSSIERVIPVSIELTNNLKKLDEIGNLKENWNGYDAVVFSKKFINDIKGKIITLIYQPEIFPISYGNVQLEYNRNDGGYLEFEITPDHKIECYLELPDGTCKEYEIVDFNEINQEVKNFYDF